MTFIIARKRDGKYVLPPGRDHSYTVDERQAWRFPTREAAEEHRCGNEVILEVKS